jgi:DNA-binding Lrp family transcriptional regulator
MDMGLKDMSKLVKAYLLANVKSGVEYKVAQKIRDMKEVTKVLVTYGLWDLIARIEAETLGHLDRIITDIRQIKEMEQTSTCARTNKLLKISKRTSVQRT